MSTAHFDVIIIGTGAGGGALARRLAPSGKHILILERGTFLPQEKENSGHQSGLCRIAIIPMKFGRIAKGGLSIRRPPIGLGAIRRSTAPLSFRLRERDFEEVQHEGGISPAWPLKYRDYQSSTTKPRSCIQAHGQRGADPTEPPTGQPYPHPPVTNEPRVQEIHDELKARGYHPFPCPVGIKLNERVRWQSQCIRCDTCDELPASSRPSRTPTITAFDPSSNCQM